ncbi:hypothetical protein ME763_25165 [Streptomyces murinus]|uniref:hypothetical protein n=1 Tax=Streptomyces murinus TaxID=33900 RepID=UPI0015564B46|nr:hypothetical protein [Streptomyces murinus]WDO08662.1 hypothetical protein ME763_25165 [Streptomyces murinus]
MTALELRLQAMNEELAQAEPSVIHQGMALTGGDILSDDNLPGLWRILNNIC